MPIMVKKKKWILYKHTCNYDIIKAVALDVKNNCKADVSDKERQRMKERLSELNLYKTRNPKHKPLDSINHRINTLEFWMFGYEQLINKQKKFIFSPLGNLFLKHINNHQKCRKIFMTMLFAMQFQHPASGTDKDFQLYPFRLIFKLLLDTRLENKLYNYEVELFLVFINRINETVYGELVNKLLKLRKEPNSLIAKMLKNDEHTMVNAVHEWEYFTKKLLTTVDIFEYQKGENICKLYHPTKTNSKSKPTARTATTGYLSLKSDLIDFCSLLSHEYSYVESPLKLDAHDRLSIDVIKEIYNFYPKILLDEIGEQNAAFNSDLLELPKLIELYSLNKNNATAYKFEDVLVKGFDMFSNVDVSKLTGAGKTDIECLYLTKQMKFAVEAKSTAKKLTYINAGRLKKHRNDISATYTIVITPKYVPSVRYDIMDEKIVIIQASTFAEYLYNHIFHEVRDIDYKDIDDIIIQNFGNDISQTISDFTLNKFATA
jgi:type II restriction enzyme